MPDTHSKLADLPVEIDGYRLETRTRDVSSRFRRVTTLIVLHGGGMEGVGEDVTYERDYHAELSERPPELPCRGTTTIDGFSAAFHGVERFRRWAFEGAALDLALRQANVPLHEVLSRKPRPIEFVVSLGLGDPPSFEPVRRLLAAYPRIRFKLDATSAWTEELVQRLVRTGAVATIDLKGHYVGTIVDQRPDPELYRSVVETFPDAWIEDPALTSETEPILAAHRDRVSWDAPVHSVADILSLAHAPRGINIKPSRFGSLKALCETYDHCAEQGIVMYGGGQFELDIGRGQIQYLASLFHPNGPNDVAPTGFNVPNPPHGLPVAPLAAAPAATGFQWQ